MAIDVTTFHSELESAKAAIAAGDMLLAREWINTAKTTLAGMADGKVGRAEIRWRRSELDEVIQSLKELESARAAGPNRMAFRALPTQFT